MPNNLQPPENCNWWTIGDSTPNPPEDRDFLTSLASAGYKTYISEGGLAGSVFNDRAIDLIHRGFGRRWRIGFLQANEEQFNVTVTSLPKYQEASVAWLKGKTVDDVKQLLNI